MSSTRVPIIVTTLTVALLLATTASAQLNVTKTADTNDGTCDADCSLREAVVVANNTPGLQTITVPAGTYVLTRLGINDEVANTGDLDLTETVNIQGAGPYLTVIDGNGTDRIFHTLLSGNPTAVTISDLTIRNGNAAGSVNPDGGAIYVDGSTNLTLERVRVINSQTPGLGGGILNNETITVRDSVIANNSATSGNGEGGGVHNLAMMTIERSTLSANRANVNGATDGGGIYNDSQMTLNNVTISGNQAGNDGGGIYNNSSLTINNITLSGNTASNNGSAIRNRSIINIRNTIVVGTCSNAGLLTSNGGNLESPAGTCGFSSTGDVSNITAGALNLGPLANNGVLSYSHRPGFRSLAIETGNNTGCPATDQRNFTRPGDSDYNGAAVCEKGSMEFVPIFVSGFEMGSCGTWTLSTPPC